MFSQAAENVGLVWNPPPLPDSSRLDEWFLGGSRAGSQSLPPVPFSRKCMRSLQDCGRHLSLPETNLGAPPPLDGGAALGYTGISSVEQSVAMQL